MAEIVQVTETSVGATQLAEMAPWRLLLWRGARSTIYSFLIRSWERAGCSDAPYPLGGHMAPRPENRGRASSGFDTGRASCEIVAAFSHFARTPQPD